MNSLWRIFWLELTSLVRSWTVLMLLAASLAWMFAMPRLVTGDGTVEGFRELFVSYGLGGVFTITMSETSPTAPRAGGRRPARAARTARSWTSWRR